MNEMQRKYLIKSDSVRTSVQLHPSRLTAASLVSEQEGCLSGELL